MNQEILKHAKALWDYHHLNHQLEKADLIMAQGSQDLTVVNRAAELFKENYAPLILFTGGYGKITKDLWNEPEADKFASVAIELGVPKDKIIIENKASNTGENITLSYELLQKINLKPQKIIIVQKPYMERRAFATFKKQWPDPNTQILVSSPNTTFEDYMNTDEEKQDLIINLMVGDLQRIIEYPKLGFQIEQEVPQSVLDSYNELINLGFNKQLI